MGKCGTVIVCIILLSILIPAVMYSFHFYYDPGYYNNFNFKLTIPIPKPVKDTIPPITNTTPINIDSLFEELSHHFLELISCDPPKLLCPSPSSLTILVMLTWLRVSLHYSTHILPSLLHSINAAFFTCWMLNTLIFRNICSWTTGTQHQPPHYTPLTSMAIEYTTTDVPMDWEPSFMTTEPLAQTGFGLCSGDRLPTATSSSTMDQVQCKDNEPMDWQPQSPTDPGLVITPHSTLPTFYLFHVNMI